MEDDLKQLTEAMDCLKDQKARLEFELKQVEKEIETHYKEVKKKCK